MWDAERHELFAELRCTSFGVAKKEFSPLSLSALALLVPFTLFFVVDKNHYASKCWNKSTLVLFHNTRIVSRPKSFSAQLPTCLLSRLVVGPWASSGLAQFIVFPLLPFFLFLFAKLGNVAFLFHRIHFNCEERFAIDTLRGKLREKRVFRSDSLCVCKPGLHREKNIWSTLFLYDFRL